MDIFCTLTNYLSLNGITSPYFQVSLPLFGGSPYMDAFAMGIYTKSTLFLLLVSYPVALAVDTYSLDWSHKCPCVTFTWLLHLVISCSLSSLSSLLHFFQWPDQPWCPRTHWLLLFPLVPHFIIPSFLIDLHHVFYILCFMFCVFTALSIHFTWGCRWHEWLVFHSLYTAWGSHWHEWWIFSPSYLTMILHIKW